MRKEIQMPLRQWRNTKTCSHKKLRNQSTLRSQTTRLAKIKNSLVKRRGNELSHQFSVGE